MDIMNIDNTTGGLGWTSYPLGKSLAPYTEIWDKLNAELCGSNPYFDSNFIEPLLAHFSTGKEKLCVHRSNGGIDGLVIIVPSRLGKWTLFLPAQAQVVPVLVRNPESLRRLVKDIPGFSLGLELPCQDTLYSPSFDAIQDLLWGPVPHTHTIGVKLDHDFQDYWAARSANLRKSVGRRLREVKDSGIAMQLKCLTESSDMTVAVSRFGEIESCGWKGRNGTAVHADNAQGRFYSEVMTRFASLGRATVYELSFNDKVVAILLCIASPSMLVLLKTTYDEQQSALSPGRLLLHALLEKEFVSKRATEVEFYTNADSVQLAWATHDRWINHYLLFRSSFVGTAYRLLKQVRDRLSAKKEADQPDAEKQTVPSVNP